jgi:transaldolase
MQNPLQQLQVKLFADGADKAGILSLNANPLIQGMTTNPTLMRKAGVKDYESCCTASPPSRSLSRCSRTISRR